LGWCVVIVAIAITSTSATSATAGDRASATTRRVRTRTNHRGVVDSSVVGVRRTGSTGREAFRISSTADALVARALPTTRSARGIVDEVPITRGGHARPQDGGRSEGGHLSHIRTTKGSGASRGGRELASSTCLSTAHTAIANVGCTDSDTDGTPDMDGDSTIEELM
jgi:hypothetical protein